MRDGGRVHARLRYASAALLDPVVSGRIRSEKVTQYIPRMNIVVVSEHSRLAKGKSHWLEKPAAGLSTAALCTADILPQSTPT
jgi:hypothetical protein